MVERRIKDNAPTRELMTRFDTGHKATVGQPAVFVPGRDAKRLADFWRSHGLEVVEQVIDDYFTSTDRFITENGYTVPHMMSQAAKLIQRRQRQTIRPRWTEDWYPECERLHGHACAGKREHEQRMSDGR